MFDIGASELLLIVVVAVLVIGPKDMPLALRTAGRWIGKVRRVSGHFRSGLETMIREAELEDMEKKWAEQNRRIMAENPAGEMTQDGLVNAAPEAPAAQLLPPLPEASGNAVPGSAEAAAAEPAALPAAKPASSTAS